MYRRGNPGARAELRAGGARARSRSAAGSTATSCPHDIHADHEERRPPALAGLGLMGVAKDTYPRDGDTYSFVDRLRRGRGRRRDGQGDARRLSSASATSARSSTRAACMAQINGGSCLGIAHALCQKLGVRPAVRAVARAALPLQQAADDSRHPARTCRPTALDIADPETPVGARGVGEPPVGAGYGAVMNAIADAVGVDVVPPRAGDVRHHPDVARARPPDARTVAGASCRWPQMDVRSCRTLADRVHGSASPEAPEHDPDIVNLASAFRLTSETTMAVIRDVMPAFELFQPTSVDDALALLDRHGADAWVLAGGLDSFDWLKDRIKRPSVVVDLSGVAELKGIRPWRRPRDRRDDDADRGRARIRSCASVTAFCWKAAELGRVAADSQSGHDRRQRHAGHALLVLPRRLAVLPRRRQHLLRRHAAGDQPRARDLRAPIAASPSTRPTPRPRSSRSTRRW